MKSYLKQIFLFCLLISGTSIAQITVTPTSWDYGNVHVGNYSSKSFTILNNTMSGIYCDIYVYVSGPDTVSDHFIITSGGGLDHYIGPRTAHSVTVKFQPTSYGSKSATLKLSCTTDPSLTGTGVAPDILVTPASWNFGAVPIGGYSAEKSFAVKNIGNDTLHVTGVSIVGANASEFHKGGSNSFPVPPGLTANYIIVNFGPTSYGAKSATLRIASDDPDENPTDVGLSGSVLTPDINVSPSSHNFGLVVLGHTSTQTFLIENVGSDDLQIIGTTIIGANASEFSQTMGPTQITLQPKSYCEAASKAVAPGSKQISTTNVCSYNIEITYSPTSYGSKSATLRFSNNDPDEDPKDIPLNGSVLASDIAVTPTSYNYNSVNIGSFVEKIFTVKNYGTASLNVSRSQITGTNADQFSISAGSGSFTLADSNTSKQVTVRFKPTARSSKSAALRFTNNDPDENPLDVNLTGTGKAAEITTSPTLLDFGQTKVNEQKQLSLLINNTGDNDLIISSIYDTGDTENCFHYVSQDTTFILKPRGQKSIVYSFRPVSTGDKTATLCISSNDPVKQLAQIVLKGTGIDIYPRLAASCDSLNFGIVSAGSAEKIISISNIGYGLLDISEITITGTDADQFLLLHGGCPLILPIGGTHRITVKLSPYSAGTKKAYLHIVSNDPNGAIQDIALSGTGTLEQVPDIAVWFDPLRLWHSLEKIDFGVVTINHKITKTITLFNQGKTNLVLTAATIQSEAASPFNLEETYDNSVINPQAQKEINIAYTPTAVGYQTATLSLAINDPDEPLKEISLTGTGIEQLVPYLSIHSSTSLMEFEGVDFYTIQPGQTSSMELVLENYGAADLNITNIKISGADSGLFHFSPPNRSVSIPPNSSYILNVQYAPATIGCKTAALEITSNDANAATTVIPLDAKSTGEMYDAADYLDFGSVEIGDSWIKPFTINNIGVETITAQIITVAGMDGVKFTALNQGPLQIQPGRSDSLQVQFTPARAGNHTAGMKISFDAPYACTQYVFMRGNGMVPENAELFISPSSHDFGNVQIGDIGEKTFYLRNTGNANLQIFNMSIADDSLHQFLLLTDSTNLTITPRDSSSFKVQFRPTNTGAIEATLRITSNDKDDGIENVLLRGQGFIEQYPKLVVSPESYDFGSIDVGENGEKTFYLRNVGKSNLQITNISIADDSLHQFLLQTDSTNYTISPGDSTSFKVQFQPAKAGTIQVTLRITSNDADEAIKNVVLLGTGILVQNPKLVISPESYDFGSIDVGDTGEITFFLRNTGTANLQIREISLPENELNQFLLLSDSTSYVISPGDYRFIQMRFIPTIVGLAAIELQVTSTDIEAPVQNISFSGTGMVRPFKILPVSWNFGSITIDHSDENRFVLSNTSNETINVLSVELTGIDKDQFSTSEIKTPFTIYPGENRILYIQFKPTRTSKDTAAVFFTTDNTESLQREIPLYGEAITDQIVSFEVFPVEWNFASIGVGDTTEKELIIKNNGSKDLHISSMKLHGAGSDQFQLLQPLENHTIQPMDSAQVLINFMPVLIGNFSTYLSITSDASESSAKEFWLYGRGVVKHIEIKPFEWDYGTVTLSNVSEKIFTVVNSGVTILHITSAAIIGADPDQYKIVYGADPFTVSPGGSRSIKVQFQPTMAGEKKAAFRIFSDDTDEGMKDIILNGIGTDSSVPNIQSEPEELNFSTLALGGIKEKTFYITNTGKADLQISQIKITGENSDQFLLQSPLEYLTLSPGDSQEVTVQFTPTLLGAFTAVLQLINNDPDEPQKNIPLSGKSIVSLIDIQPPYVDFKNVTIDSTAEQIFILKNTGQLRLNVTNIQVTGSQADQFTIVTGGDPFQLSPGSTHHLVISFAPTSGGRKRATLQIVSDDMDEPVKEILLNGTATAAVISVNPASWDFQEVTIDSTAQIVFTIKNSGNAKLRIDSLSIIGEYPDYFSFSSNELPYYVYPGQSTQILVIFSPMAAGPYNAILRMITNLKNQNPIEMPLTGTGIEILKPRISAAETSWDFGRLTIGKTKIKSLLITNIGKSSLQIASLSLPDDLTQSFAILNDNLPIEIQPDLSDSIIVSFQPKWTGSVTSNLEIQSNDNPFYISLSGYGEAIRIQGLNKPSAQPSGSEETSYRLISVPVLLDDNSIDALFLDDLGAVDNKQWRLFDYVNGNYLEYPSISPIQPGKALWLIVKNSASLNCGSGYLIGDMHYDIPLMPGWNAIGNPYNFGINIGQFSLVSNNYMQTWTYNGQWTNEIQSLEPWEGYAVLNDQQIVDTLVVNPAVQMSALSRQQVTEELEWHIDIKGLCQAASDNKNTLGISKSADDSYDVLDKGEPPPIGHYIMVYFEHPEWHRSIDLFSSDIKSAKSDGWKWDFNVRTNIPTADVRVDFSGMQTVPEDLQIMVRDAKQTLSAINLRENKSIIFKSAADENVHHFTLLIGSKEYISQNDPTQSALVTDFKLYDAFPNPFNSTTSFQLSVPADEVITIAIYDIIGRKIAILVADRKVERGIHTFTWNGFDDQRGPAASGVYFLRLDNQNNKHITKKLVLIK